MLVVTIAKPAVVKVPLPVQRGSAFVDVRVRGYVPPQGGPVDAIVTLSGRSGSGHEVGRFSVFPAEPFSAKDPSEERTFRLDATKALSSVTTDGPVTITLNLVPTDPARPPVGASMTIAHIRLSSRH